MPNYIYFYSIDITTIFYRHYLHYINHLVDMLYGKQFHVHQIIMVIIFTLGINCTYNIL